MKTFINSLFVVVLTSLISLTGCSKDAVKKDAQIDKTDNKDTKTVEQKVNTIRGESVVKNTMDSENLKSEVLINNSITKPDSAKSDEELENEAIAAQNRLRELQKVYFDYDRSDIRDDAKDTLETNADILKDKDESDVLIEGYCDERGTEEYNLALGQRRAESVRKYLISLGINNTRMSTISYGEAKPEAIGSNESAWQQNRRAVLKEVKD